MRTRLMLYTLFILSLLVVPMAAQAARCTICHGEFMRSDQNGISDIVLNAPVALYSVDYNNSAEFGLHLYQKNADGTQTLALEITPDLLQTLTSDKLQLVAESEDRLVQVFRLPNGKWQVNATQRSGKIYVGIFDSRATGTPLYEYVR